MADLVGMEHALMTLPPCPVLMLGLVPALDAPPAGLANSGGGDGNI